MAYNYEEFVRAANNAGMLNRFSQADLDAAKTNPEFGYSMLQMYQNRDKATTAEQRLLADETANQLRKSYGVAPGLPASAFGGDTDSVTRGGFGGSFDAKKSSTENTKSQTTTKSKTSTTTGSGPAFDYDPEQDPRMAAYRKTYLREAERAREDAMAKAAAMTGGVPSSYAVGAADQAGNYFVSQLTDKIPELYKTPAAKSQKTGSVHQGSPTEKKKNGDVYRELSRMVQESKPKVKYAPRADDPYLKKTLERDSARLDPEVEAEAAERVYQEYLNSEEYRQKQNARTQERLQRLAMMDLTGIPEQYRPLMDYQEEDEKEVQLRTRAQELRAQADRKKQWETWENIDALVAEADAAYETYIHSPEYAAWQLTQEKQAMDAIAQRGITQAPTGSPYGATGQQVQPGSNANAVAEELKAKAEYYRQIQTQKQEQAQIDADMKLLAKWSPEDRKALLNYINSRQVEFYGQIADPSQAGLRMAWLEAEELKSRKGAQTVERMAESYTRYLNRKQAEATQAEAIEDANSGLLGATGASIGSVAANLLGSMTGFAGYAEEAAYRTGTYKSLDPNNMGMMPSAYAGAVRQQVGQNIEESAFGKAGATVYQAGMSALDNIARMVVGGGKLSLGLAAMGSFGQTVQQMSAQGANPVEATALGVINGGLEILTEKMSLDNMLNAMENPKTGVEILKAALQAGAVEVSEEELSFIGSTLAEAMVLRERSGYQQQVAMLTAMGLPEALAREQASRGVIDEAVQTAVQSFLSGGFMSGGTTVYANVQNKIQSRRDGERLQETVQEARAALEQKHDSDQVIPDTAAPAGQKHQQTATTAPVRATPGGTVTVREGAAVSREQLEQVERISGFTGRQIELYQAENENEEGWYDTNTGVLHIAASEKNPDARVIAHELTHSVETAPMYKELSSLVMARIQKTGGNLEQLRQKKQALYARNGITLENLDDIDREIVAGYVAEHLLTSEAEIMSLSTENPGIARKILNWLNDLLAKMGNANAQERTFIRKARDAYAKALEQTGAPLRDDAGKSVRQLKARKTATEEQHRKGEISDEDLDAFYDEYNREMELLGVDPMAAEDDRFRKRDRDEGRDEVMRYFEEAYRNGDISKEEYDAFVKEVGDGVRFSFAGGNAETADLDALSRAMDMEKQGHDAENIRQNTGWFRGMDKKWRFEIDDSKMKYQRRGDLGFRERVGSYDRYRKLIEKAEDFMLGKSNAWLTEPEQSELTELQKTWSESFRKEGQISPSARPSDRLSDYLSHDELFKAYPQLKDARLLFDELESGTKGKYDGSSNTITLSNNLRSAPENTLIHEIQHAIQKIEGFTPGASVEYWKEQRRDIVETIAAARRNLDLWLEDIGYPEARQKSLLAASRREKTMDQHWKDMAEFKAESKYARQIAACEAELAEFQRQYDEITHGMTAYEQYENTAGEIEARDVSTRRSMDAEGRKKTPPILGGEDTVFADRGDSAYSIRNIDIDRNYITYGDIESEVEAIDRVTRNLRNAGKMVSISEADVADHQSAISWSDRKEIRQYLKRILKDFLGATVQFTHNGKTAQAYLTKDGINHSAVGLNTPIAVSEVSLNAYYGKHAEEYKRWERVDFDEAIDKCLADLQNVQRYATDRAERETEKQSAKTEITVEEAEQLWKDLKTYRKEYQKIIAKHLLTDHDEMQVGRLLRGEITLEYLANEENFDGIEAVYRAKAEYEKVNKQLKRYKAQIRAARLADADRLLETANTWIDKKTGIAYSRETMRRNVLDIVKDKALAQEILQEYFEPVQISQASATRFKNLYRDRVRELKLSDKVEKGNKVSEAYAVQLLGEAMDNMEMISKSRGRIKTRDGMDLEEWQGMLDELWAENPKLDTEKIRNAVKEFRKIYDELFQEMNRVRLENGYEPVNYRKGYFPHFQSENGDSIIDYFGKTFGINTSVDALPTTINGLTHTFKPGIQWFGHAQERKGFQTTYDALQGFDKYIEGVANVIYQTENIQKLRAFATQARYRTSDEGLRAQVDRVNANPELTEEEKLAQIKDIFENGRYSLSNFVVELDEYTNILAGKKSKYDRTMESLMGRRAYTVMKNIESKVGANMIAGNLGSALTNFIPLTQAAARISPKYMLKGMKDAAKAVIGKDGFVAGMSDFLTNRRGTDALVKGWQEKLSGVLGTPMELIDNLVSESIVRAAYYQNQARGLSDSEAMHQADIFAAGVMADRSKGALPTVFESSNPIFKAFTQFQVEVNNQYSEVFKDIPREYTDRAKWVLAACFFKYFIGAFLWNKLEEELRGRASAMDPIGITENFIQDWRTVGFGDSIANLTVNVLEELPFTSALALLGMDIDAGRIPISSAMPDIPGVWDALTDKDMAGEKRYKTLTEELQKPITYLLMPAGGNQAAKTWKGLKAFFEGGSYGVDGDGQEILQYPVYKDFWEMARATVFGKSATKGGREWAEDGFDSFNAKQTALYKDLKEAGADEKEAYRLIDEIRAVKKGTEPDAAKVQKDARLKLIRESGLSDECKDVVYYGLVANEAERDLMDALSDEGFKEGLYKFTSEFMDAKKLDGAARKDALRDVIQDAPLTEAEKQIVIAEILGDKEVGDSGKLTTYGKFVYAKQYGLTADEFMDMYANDTDIDDFLELREGDVAADSAKELATALGALELSNLSSTEKWNKQCDAILNADVSEAEKVTALVNVSYESTGRMIQIGYDNGISPDLCVALKRIQPSYDANSNGNYSQEDVKNAIDAISGSEVYLAATGGKPKLTNEQKAMLWQLSNKGWKYWKNPYDKDVGQRISELMAVYGEKEPELADTFAEEVQKQILGK